MALMAQNPEDEMEQAYKMAPPVSAYAAAVDPHATLTTPIGPPAPEPVTMAPGASGGGKMSAKAPEQAEAPPTKMSALKPQEEHINNRLMADYQKDADPYGSPDNHPGFFGKLLHGLNVATGGVNRRGMEEQGLEKRVQDIGKQESEQGLQGAETAGKNLENENAPQKAADTHNQSVATTGNLDSETQTRNEAAKNPSLAVAYSHAVNKALDEGRDPKDDPIVQHLSDAITGLQPAQNKPNEAPKTITAVRPGIKGPHEYAWDPKTNAYDIDEGEHFEKPMNVNVNAGTAALDRETKQFGGSHQKAVDAANTQLEKIEDAKNMINGNAESQALGVPKVLTALVSGAGSGVRITQPELNAIAKARGWGGDIQGTLNSISGQGKLTSTQQKQLSGILDDVKTRIMQKQAIASEALDQINGASSRDQIIQADKTARQKLSDMEKGGAGGGMIRALDDKGVLHEAPAGTPLPKGWKAQ